MEEEVPQVEEEKKISDPNQARLANLAKAREAAKKKKAETIKIIPIETPKEPEPLPIIKPRRILVKHRVQAPKRKREEEVEKDVPKPSNTSAILDHVGRFLLALGGVAISATLPAILKTIFPTDGLGNVQSNTESRRSEQNPARIDLFYDQSIFY